MHAPFLLLFIFLLVTITPIANTFVQAAYANDDSSSKVDNGQNITIFQLLPNAQELPVGGPRDSRFISIILDGLGAISSVLGIFDFISNRIAGSSGGNYNAELQKITSQLNSLSKQVDSTIAEIRIESMKTQLAPHETIIWNSLRAADNYLQFKTEDRKKIFLKTTVDLENSIFTIIRRLTTPYLTGSQPILQELKDYTDRTAASPRKQFIKYADNFMLLLAVGTAPLVLAYDIKNTSKVERNGIRKDLSNYEIAAINKMRELEVQLRDESRVVDQLTYIMTNQIAGKNSADVAKQLFNYLSARYDTVNWAVIVYAPITGYQVHTVSGTRRYDVFRTGGKNAVAFSSDEVGYCPQNEVKSRIRSYCDVKTNSYKKDYSRCSSVYVNEQRCTHHTAVNVVNELKTFGNVDPGTKLAVIVSDAGPEITTSGGFCYTSTSYPSTIVKTSPFTTKTIHGLSLFAFLSNLDFRRNPQPSSTKYFRIRSQMNGRVMTIDPTTKNVLMVASNERDDNQLWYKDGGIRSKNGYCLKSFGHYYWTVTSAPCPANYSSDPLSWWDYKNSVISLLSEPEPKKTCLNVLNSYRYNGAPVVQYSCNGQINQKWDLVY